MKLHLGCGQVYLKGYQNIDYPPSKHTIQKTSVADQFSDITKLTYKPNSVNEVRLHHVFEHFPRAQALGLIMSWSSWLKKGGKITIEVPDFGRMTRLYNSPLTKESVKWVALRHIFGSQEAPWAVHYHGWTKRDILEVARMAGFEATCKETKSHTNILNIVLSGIKKENINLADSQVRVEKYLSKYKVDDSETERIMLLEWMKIYNRQVKFSWAK